MIEILRYIYSLHQEILSFLEVRFGTWEIYFFDAHIHKQDYEPFFALQNFDWTLLWQFLYIAILTTSGFSVNIISIGALDLNLIAFATFGIIVSLIAILFDYLTLSKISAYNQKNRSEKPSYTKSFVAFFIVWRFFLFDVFLASSIGAFATNMQLSKKDIFLLALIAQLLRCTFAVIALWSVFS